MDHRIYSILSVIGYELHTYESTLAGYELLVLSLGELYQILDGCLQGLVLKEPEAHTGSKYHKSSKMSPFIWNP